MYKYVNPKKLTEGDWIAKNIIIKGKQICGPKDLGISKKQIQKLISLKKYDLVEVNLPLLEPNNVVKISVNNLYATSNPILLSIIKKKLNQLPPTMVFREPKTSISYIKSNKFLKIKFGILGATFVGISFDFRTSLHNFLISLAISVSISIVPSGVSQIPSSTIATGAPIP